MGMYDDIIERLKAEAANMGSREALRGVVKATKASFHNTLNGKTGPNSRTFMDWLERLHVVVVFPGDPLPGVPQDAALLQQRIAQLESELSHKEKELLKVQGKLEESREQLHRLMDKQSMGSTSSQDPYPKERKQSVA